MNLSLDAAAVANRAKAATVAIDAAAGAAGAADFEAVFDSLAPQSPARERGRGEAARRVRLLRAARKEIE